MNDSPQTTTKPPTTATAPASSTEISATPHEPPTQSGPQTSEDGQHEEVQRSVTNEPTEVTDQGLPFPRTKEQATQFKRIRIEETEK